MADENSDDSGPDLQRVLPDGPLPESVLDSLAEKDRVEGLTPMKMDRKNGQMVVYDFTIELQETAYALRYEDEWTVIAEGDDERTVGLELQEYHHEHGLA